MRMTGVKKPQCRNFDDKFPEFNQNHIKDDL